MSEIQSGLTLVLGGVRSGKSAFAERLAARHAGPICYVATAEALDDEMRARAAAHRAARSAAWQTIEAPLDPAATLHRAGRPAAVLLDCLTVWTSNLLLTELDQDSARIDPSAAAHAEACARSAVAALLDWQRETATPLYIVSNEVGLGVTPPYPLGRVYRDTLGRLNQQVVMRAERVYLVVAGLALDLKALGATSIDAPPRLPLD